MKNRWMAVAAAWLVFSLYTTVVMIKGGLLSLLTIPAAHPWGLQLIFDLFTALIVAMAFIAPKARRVGVPVVPYVLATLVLGSVGLLAFVTHVEWAAERDR